MAHSRKTIFTLTALTGILVASALGGAWYAYGQIGKTPGELMDYAEHRLQGHNKLESVALPIIGVVRDVLDQPSKADMLKIPFVVPPPPPRYIAPPDSDSTTESNALSNGRRVLHVGPEDEFPTIAAAAKAARDDDIVEIMAGDYHGDVALWGQKKLTIRTLGGNARLFADGTSAEGKAIWVIRNGDFDIENIDFIGAHVDDHNGAGIRFEDGNLHIKNCLFYGNDTGLLTTGSAGDLNIEDSEFAFNGFGDGQSHDLYVGRIRSLRITGSYFHHANVGHLLKSRAKKNFIYYNRLTDESGGRASYEVDLPDGGLAYVVGNIIEQNTQAQNSTIIAYGEEGLAGPDNKLFLASNTIVNDMPYGGTFLLAAPGTQRVVSINNLLVGKGTIERTAVAVESINNIRAGWEIFEQASRYDYRLNARGRALSLTMPTMPEIIPRREYAATRETHELTKVPNYPGAVQ